jgi:hypothetical protein
MNKKYTVRVDDNYHYMDESERYDDSSYATLEEAIKRCEELTIESIKGCYEKGIDASKLMAQWAMFGEDPFIVGGKEKKPPFSAREFISEKLCAKIIKEIENKK